MADRIGQQLGLYRLIRFIGRGSFAEIYLGEHVRMLTQSVVKVFQVQLTPEEEERFGEEARVVSRLGHPHIMPLVDVGVQDSTPFLVMGYAPNGTLRDQFPPGMPQAPGAILPYIWQVADALHFAHGQRVMHRNLKPENMLLDSRGEVLLSDFALPVIFQSPRYQAALERAGAATYLAPEQIRGQTIPASDQYALAATVYEWLSGGPLFQGSITEIMAKHLFTEPTPLRERVRTISPAIEVVLLGALSKDPADRFPSVESFARAFEEASQAVPVLLFMPPVLVDAPEPEEQNTTEAALAPTAAPAVAEQETTPQPIVSAPLNMPPAESLDGPPAASAAPVSPADDQPIITPAPARPPEDQPISTPAPSPEGQPIITPPPSHAPVVAEPVASSEPEPSAAPPAAPILVSAPPGALFARPESPAAMPTPAFTVPGRPRMTQPLVAPAQPDAAPPPAAAPAPNPPVPAMPAPSAPAPSASAASAPNHSRSSPTLGATWREVDWIPTPALTPAYPASAPVGAPREGISRRALLVGGMVGLLGVAGALTWLGVDKLSRHSSGSAPRVAATAKPTATPTPTPVPQPGDTLFTYHGHTGFLRSVSWSPDGARIASASDDGTVQVWDALTGAAPYTYRGHSSPVMAVAWSPDGTMIASGSQDNTLQVWNPTSGQMLFSFTFGKQVMGVAWSLDGAYLAAVSWDYTIGVWDAKTWRRLHRFVAFGAVNTLAWSPDNIHIVTGDADKQAVIWNVDTGGRIRTYRGQTGSILALAWSPDRTGIASGADLPDMTLQYWNSLSLEKLWSINTQGATPALAWSPKGTQLAAGGSVVSLLDPATGNQLLSYQGDGAALAWSPNGAYIASGGQSTTVQVWLAN